MRAKPKATGNRKGKVYQLPPCWHLCLSLTLARFFQERVQPIFTKRESCLGSLQTLAVPEMVMATVLLR